MHKELFIVAAGKGSRMNHNKPKAMMKIGEEPNVLRTIRLAFDHYDIVYVGINEDHLDAWAPIQREIDKFEGRVKMIAIKSGLGDGNAVMRMLNHPWYIPYPDSMTTVVWGDTVFQDSQPFYDASFWPRNYVAVHHKEKPYVSIKTVGGHIASGALFSKYDEVHGPGYHDQSLFVYRSEDLENALGAIHASGFRNGKYDYPGGEMSLLSTINYFFNMGQGMSVKKYDKEIAKSYNTFEEYSAINDMYTSL